MKNLRQKISILSLLALSLLTAGGLGCSNNKEKDILLSPFIVVIDSILNRVFVIDNQNNGMNLVDASTNFLVLGEKDAPLLDDEDPWLLPNFPSNAALVSMAGGVSRIFVTGAVPSANNLIVVLDYDDVNGLRLASFSPITVAGSPNDVLAGIAVDPDTGLVFVTNSNSGNLHAYDVTTAVENPNSPIALSGIPGRVKLDPNLNRLSIANAGNTLVTFLNTLDLTAPPETFDVGIITRDVATATNAAGTILFVSGALENIALVFELDLTNLPASTQIFSLSPPAPTDPIPDPNLLTGNLNQVVAGNLTNGQMAGYYTQSSGDLLALDLTSDLNTLTPAIVTVGAASGEGIETLINSSGLITNVYYASPGTGALTIVDPLTNLFTDQIE